MSSVASNLSDPEVSILLPCRNAQQWLPACIDSIRRQTFERFEVVAVDDHSQDATGGLLQQAARVDNRFRALRSPEPGIVPALNFGLEQSRCELVARMDADDLMHPRRLALQTAYLQQETGVDVVGTRVRGFPEEQLTAGFIEYLKWQNACIAESAISNDIYLESPLAHPSVMFRRTVIRDAGGYLNGAFPEDYELWLRLLHRGIRIGKLPQTLLDWRDYPDRTSRRDPRCSRENFDRLRARYLQRDRRLTSNGRRLAVWGAGRATRQRARHLLQGGIRPIAWVDVDPNKIGNRIDGVPVVDPSWLRQQDKPFVLSYVAVHGARECIDAELHRLGYRKGNDYLHVG